MASNTINPQRTASELLQDVMHDVSDVVRGEIRLAKAEVSEKTAKAGKAAGMFGAAAVCGLMACAALVAAGIAALALVMPVWLAAAIMAVLLGGAGGAAYAGGRAKLKSVNPVPERTVETIKDDIEWAKRRTT